MKEARAHRTIDFDDGGHPRSVADRSLRWKLTEMLAKAAGNLPKFSGRFGDVFVIDTRFIFQNEPFDLFFECFDLFEVQAYFTLLFARPY
jgi:hypothetical protein